MITTSINRGDQPFYNVAEYLCDYQSDVADLPTHRGPGSRATVIENGNVYILNGAHEWVLQTTSSSTSSTDNIIYDGGEVTENSSSNNVTYDGGEIITDSSSDDNFVYDGSEITDSN